MGTLWEQLTQDTNSQKNNFRRKAKVFQLLDGTLYYLHKKHSSVRVVRFEEKAAILKACHTTATARHQGVNRTATKIRERYWWVGMQQDIVEYVDTCEKCQRQNQLRKTPSVLHPIPVHDGPFSMVGLDLVGPLQETTSGNKYIAVLTDYLTKWPEVKAIPSKHADVICDFIIEVICRHGAPKTILTDRGREFCNSLNDKLCQSMGIQHRVSAPYHPQTNGLTERFNQTLCSALTKYVSEKQDDWDQYLQQVAFAARTCQQKSTKESPFYLIYGRKVVLPIQLDIPTTVPNMQRQQTEEEFDEIYSDRITSFVELLKAHDAAKDNISIEQKKQKTYYDRKHGTADLLQPGQRVLLRNSKRINRKGDKMLHRWTGPYTISTCIGEGVYKLVERKEIANIKSIKLYRENLTVTTENQKSQSRRKTKQSATSKKRVSGLQRCRRRKREQKKAFKPTCSTVVMRRRSSRNSAVSQPKTEFTAPTVKGQGKCTSISQISKRKIKGRSNKSKLKTLQKGRSCHVHPNRRLRVSEVSNSPKVSKSSSRTLKKRKGSTIEEKPSKRVKGIEKTKLQPSQNVYLRSYSSDDIISIVRHCSKYSLADTAPRSPPVSLYLACQRESKDDLNQCVNDLMEVISGAHSQDMSLQESSETAPGLMLAAAIFIQSYKILIPAQKFLPTLDSVPLGNSTSSCKRPKGQINRLRVGGIVLNEADISTLDSTNWLNDKIIHSYLGLLSWQCNSKEPQSAYVLSCFVATKWENGDYSSWLFPKVPLQSSHL
ncbi:uncharacterized protein LOC133189855 [Saccostrea echinata]|uniref:uncharacterized protein LOC133189855 n=1 Tax=Saccostrea echinata TaxID=191078 RepID=UPI002A83170E|nr:uncharacterized protein LOC133189855 [Saccostrea echinata]